MLHLPGINNMKSLSFIPLAALLALSTPGVSYSGAAFDPSGPGQAAAPDFGPNVLVFDPSMTNIQSQLDAIFRKQESNQFGSDRYAYLFKPGQYRLDVQMGFYMQALGLGQSPDRVAITGAVRSTAGWMRGNATCNFWRAVENLSVTPTQDRNPDIWAVSQGTALRRVHVKGDLNLWDGGWSSGGFIADCLIDGRVNSGSQQQWLSRNAQWGSWTGGSWNMVFVGVVNPPERGRGLWSWCFHVPGQNRFTWFHIDPSRGSKVLKRYLGKTFRGIVGCDYFSAYRKFLRESDAWLQLCWAHLIRDVKYLTTLLDRATRNYGHRLLSRIKTLFRTWHRRGETPAIRWERAAAKARREVLAVAR